MRWLESITYSMDMGLGGLRQLMMDREAWHAVVHRIATSWTRLSKWIELNTLSYLTPESEPDVYVTLKCPDVSV